ncbi:MAG: DUF4194 domain-containing protein [Cellulomonadaceae bacterium]|jgi:hypothetical protein|nr:DUF4194 domain-containing protein [Cellulomonadaceae bacterium]
MSDQTWTDVGLDEVTDVDLPPQPNANPAEASADSHDSAFITPVAMESDPEELFPGDQGTLDPDVRVILVDLLRRRFMTAEANPARWRTLLENQGIIESRLHDLFITLVVDCGRGIAYKRQVSTGEAEGAILLRDDPFTRVETVLLVHLRTLHQRESTAGERAARVDTEELEEQAMSYLDPDVTNIASQQKEVRTAIGRLAREGFLQEEAAGRYRITPLVEVVLSVERLTELATWLRNPQEATP